MNPKAPAVLMELSSLLMRHAMIDAPAPERASELSMSAMLLMIAGEVWDRQAHILVEENRAIRALLDETGADDDLHLAALKAENDRLRTRLIEAHAVAEAAGDALRQDAIWAELIASTERRRLSTEPV